MSDTETKVLRTTPAIGPVGNSTNISPLQNLKAEIAERPSSPEINCAICLEELRNTSYTNTCLHQFCFHCLLEWSKVKPECPLCKQSFSRIYHNIRSNQEYDEHVLEPQLPSSILDPHIFINVAFQRHRFRYRSTMGASMMWELQGMESMPWTSSTHIPLDYSVVPPRVRLGATTTRSMTRSQRVDSSAFRRNVYRQGLWVRPNSAARFRECSPEFYRLNPAQTHRLVPWLTRELNVLLDMQYDTQTVCQDILNLISAHHINSSVFHRAMTFYLGTTAEHFIHEFYHFAISPNDMTSYDNSAQYAQVGRGFSSESDSEVEFLNLPEPLVSLDLTAAPGPSGMQYRHSPDPATVNSTGFVVIELSDDEEPRTIDNDSDVEIIGHLPPRHLRTPEVITIGSDSESESNYRVEPKPENQSSVNLSSSEEIVDDETCEVSPEVVNISAANPHYPIPYDTSCQCPMYDNCPYSREITRLAQTKRSIYKKEGINSQSTTISPSTTGLSSASSVSSEMDDIEPSSSGRNSRRKHKKLPIKKRSCNSPVRQQKQCTSKRKRSSDNKSTTRRHCNKSSPIDITEESSSLSDSSIDVKRKRPVRLKSIVLKVDKSKKPFSSTSSSSSSSSPSSYSSSSSSSSSFNSANASLFRYKRTVRRISSSDSDD